MCLGGGDSSLLSPAGGSSSHPGGGGRGHRGGCCPQRGRKMAPAMQGQKQSSKVLGFLEEARHKDSFVQLANTGGPCQHRGCVCHAPHRKASPSQPLLPPMLPTSFPLLIYFCFIYFCGVFAGLSHVSIDCLGGRGSAPPRCPPIFWGPAQDAASHWLLMCRLLLGSGQPCAGMGRPLGKTPYVAVGF